MTTNDANTIIIGDWKFTLITPKSKEEFSEWIFNFLHSALIRVLVARKEQLKTQYLFEKRYIHGNFHHYGKIRQPNR